MTDENGHGTGPEDVFHIKGRGTVVGMLAGDGLLSAGQLLESDGQRWPVDAVQQAREVVPTVAPDATVGVLMKHGPEPAVLRGQTAGSHRTQRHPTAAVPAGSCASPPAGRAERHPAT